MRSSLFALLSLVSLTGCPALEIPIGPRPVPPAPVKLESGEYSVLIVGVTDITCDDYRAHDLVGMKLPLSLELRGHAGTGNLGGFELAGERHGGVLSLTGTAVPEVVYGEDEDTDVDTGDAGGGSSGGSSGGSDSDSGTDDNDPSTDSGDTTDTDGDVDVPPPETDEAESIDPSEELVSLELVTMRADHAEGSLFFSAGTCSFEVPVIAQKVKGGGDDPKPVPVGEETEGSGCDDEASDCG